MTQTELYNLSVLITEKHEAIKVALSKSDFNQIASLKFELSALNTKFDGNLQTLLTTVPTFNNLI